MYFYLNVVTLMCFASNCVVLLQTTNESVDVQKGAGAPIKISTSDYIPTPDTWEMNPNLKTLWVYRPASVQSQQTEDQYLQNVVLRPPHLLTRLAKPLSFGFDPYFNKGYFEPFERRQKPVTLVAFRRHGQTPRKTVKAPAGSSQKSAEVAEMQSPFNDISSLWQDAPGIINF